VKRAAAVRADREIVAKETTRRRTGPVERTALDEKDVEVAVVVEVEERDARAHHLRQIIATRRSVDVVEDEPGLRRALGKERPGCGGRACATRDDGHREHDNR
jgi:hypothetical protein